MRATPVRTFLAKKKNSSQDLTLAEFGEITDQPVFADRLQFYPVFLYSLFMRWYSIHLYWSIKEYQSI